MRFRYHIQFAIILFLGLNMMNASGQNSHSKDPNYGADSASRMACAFDLSTMAEFIES